MLPNRKSKVTIYQVAEEAGVAISTVSKVLTHKRGISEVTRLKVQEAVNRLGFVPSLAARGLTSGKTGIIGFIFAFPPQKLFGDPYLLKNFLGIEEILNENDFNMLISTALESDPTSSFERLLRSRYFDGIIIMETTEIHKMALHRRLQEQDLPWVVMGYPEGIRSCYAVYADDYSGGQMVAEHLLALGHRNIAIVTAVSRPSGVDERLRGLRDDLGKNGVKINRNMVFHGDFTTNSGYQVAKSILDRSDRPSAIFAANDRMALGIIKWAQEQGLRIPEDVSVVGFDDVEAAAESTPPLTTVRQPGVEIGREAAKMLLRLIECEQPPHQIILGTQLIVRKSTGPAA